MPARRRRSDEPARRRRAPRSGPPAERRRPRRRGRTRVADTLHHVKRLLIGRPRATRQLRATELSKPLALPVFSADPLSSVAYATEQAMIVLFVVSISGRDLILPLSGAVAGLLAIVVLSYRQTVRAYTTSGGAYAVAKDNLGTTAGLAAAAALLTDYVLTVAVSVSAGVTAITSADPSLRSLAVPMAVAFVGLLTVVNLRGVRETGLAFAAPTYGFVVAVLVTIVAGLVQCAGGCPHATVPDPKPLGSAGATIGLFVVLHAFASGSTALTGIEAISNGVGAFRRPKGVNAAGTLGAMGAIAVVLFAGVSFLAVQVKAVPSGSVSVLAEIARAVFPTGAVFPGALFYAVQLLTFAILILAANSAFQGFPRLASLLARDRFLPREFGDLGDRLVYSNGALVLAALAAAVHNAVVLYVEDVDAASHEALAYVHHLDADIIHAVHVAGRGTVGDIRAEWERAGDPLELSILETDGHDPADTVIEHVNTLERPDGEHFVTVVIPELMRKPSLTQPLRHQHALELKLRLLTEPGVVVTDVPVIDEPDAEPLAPEHIDTQASAAFVIVSAVDDATVHAVNYAQALHSFPTRALFFALHPEATEEIQHEWERRELPIPLEIVECPFRELADPLLDRLRATTRERDGIAAVVLPEPIIGGRARSLLHNRTALYLRWLLLLEPKVVLSSVPYRIP